MISLTALVIALKTMFFSGERIGMAASSVLNVLLISGCSAVLAGRLFGYHAIGSVSDKGKDSYEGSGTLSK